MPAGRLRVRVRQWFSRYGQRRGHRHLYQRAAALGSRSVVGVLELHRRVFGRHWRGHGHCVPAAGREPGRLQRLPRYCHGRRAHFGGHYLEHRHLVLWHSGLQLARPHWVDFGRGYCLFAVARIARGGRKLEQGRRNGHCLARRPAAGLRAHYRYDVSIQAFRAQQSYFQGAAQAQAAAPLDSPATYHDLHAGELFPWLERRPERRGLGHADSHWHRALSLRPRRNQESARPA